MGRTYSDMVPFLKRGLEENLYTTLTYIDKVFGKAKIRLPRKCHRLNNSDQSMLKEWERIKGRDYHNISSYSKSRQRFRQAIKKSIFLEKLSINKDEIVFRFRTAIEVTDCKQERKSSFSESAPSPVHSCSSGYFSEPEKNDIDQEIKATSKTLSILKTTSHNDNPWYKCVEKVKEEIPENILEESETQYNVYQGFPDKNWTTNGNVNSALNENQPLLVENCYMQNHDVFVEKKDSYFPVVGDSCVEKNAEMVEVQKLLKSVCAKEFCFAWKCVQVEPLDIYVLLFFEKKLYEVNSAPYRKNFPLNSGNCNIIIDQKVHETLKDYYAFKHEFIGETFVLYYQPKCFVS